MKQARRFALSRSSDEARKSVSNAQRLSRQLGSPAGGSRIFFEDVGLSARGKKKIVCATLSVRGARTDFYNPMEIFLQHLKDAAREEALTSEARSLDPGGVEAEAPDRSGHGHSTGNGPLWRVAVRRLRSIVGREKYEVAWRASCVPAGYFFMFADRVLFLMHRRAAGWSHVVVPPDGLPISSATRRLAGEDLTPRSRVE